nr:RNA-dependent RNA polymerase [Flumine narna-like virus 58]
MLEQLRRTTFEVFGRAKMTEKDLFKPYAPSIRANFTDARSDFGTLGSLVDRKLLAQFQYALPSYDEMAMDGVSQEQYLKFGEYVRKRSMNLMYEGAVKDVYEVDDFGVITVDPTHKELSLEFKERVKNRYKELYLGALELAKKEEADVKLVALPEALKVRVISKGPAFTYFVLKPVQKFLHNHMRRFKIFQYTGKPETAEDLTALLFPRPLTEAQSADPMLGLLFHSLDYESATDLFDPEVSREIVDSICDCVFQNLPTTMSKDLRRLFHLALTGHRIEGEPQAWGQLMGSIVSFIVLCIANATVIRASYEISENCEVTINEIPATANGDDGLVLASPRFAEVWESISASAGLKPSLGKTYSHHTYANINSHGFNWNREYQRLDHIPYLNMGLMYGLKRSGGAVDVVVEDGDDGEFQSSIGAVHHKLINSCPQQLVTEVHAMFIERNRDRLSSVHVPWYVPESMGGLGLMSIVEGNGDVDDVKVLFGPTKMDRLCMSLIPTLKTKPSKLPGSSPILCRTVWSNILANCKFSESDTAFLDVSTFYLLPDEVMKQKPFDHERLRRNERAWTKLRKMAKTNKNNEKRLCDCCGLHPCCCPT